MKKILFFAYPQYADFEIAHTLFFLKKVGKAQVTTVTVDGKPIESLGGLHVQPQLSIPEVNVMDYDLVLISGGDGVQEVINESSIHVILQEAIKVGVPIASICASATLLGKAGLLKGNKFTCTPGTYEHYKEVFEGAEYTGGRIEVGEGFITAKGTAFPEFTVEVGNLLNIWKDQAKADHAFDFSKGNV